MLMICVYCHISCSFPYKINNICRTAARISYFFSFSWISSYKTQGKENYCKILKMENCPLKWTIGFSKKDFLLLLFPRHFLNNLELVFLEFKHFYKTHRTSLFSFYLFFTGCFVIILCINAFHLSVFFHCV